MLLSLLTNLVLFASVGFASIAFISHLAYHFQNPQPLQFKRFDQQLESIEVFCPVLEEGFNAELESKTALSFIDALIEGNIDFEILEFSEADLEAIEQCEDLIILGEVSIDRPSFEEMRAIAKGLKIKSWASFKNPDKLWTKIQEAQA